ncbi:hypothetical protein H0H81_008749 [Sphagnurus paluster]|uniref:Uncharacterized protein n=1 Tax=Sphagnurus paluster TaxID=117069 RepID=A0A9P7FKU8_9AGAR|nr:hypothetical protein H0H81_008749 [Sphagnurus paluster]
MREDIISPGECTQEADIQDEMDLDISACPLAPCEVDALCELFSQLTLLNPDDMDVEDTGPAQLSPLCASAVSSTTTLVGDIDIDEPMPLDCIARLAPSDCMDWKFTPAPKPIKWRLKDLTVVRLGKRSKPDWFTLKSLQNGEEPSESSRPRKKEKPARNPGWLQRRRVRLMEKCRDLGAF